VLTGGRTEGGGWPEGFQPEQFRNTKQDESCRPVSLSYIYRETHPLTSPANRAIHLRGRLWTGFSGAGQYCLVTTRYRSFPDSRRIVQRFCPNGLSENRLDHFAMNISQTEMASLIFECQLGMVNPQGVQDGRLQVVNVDWIPSNVV